MTKLLFLVVGAGFGAAIRYYVAIWTAERFGLAFPYGTLIVNIIGSIVLGFFLTLATEQFEVNPNLRILIATGFCGSLTTFSTFSYDTVQLLSRGSYLLGGVNAVGSVVLGLIGVMLGVTLARALFPG